MAIKFVLCRRRDDHSITHEIAESAVEFWPEWERVPEEDLPHTPTHAELRNQAAQPSGPVPGAETPEPTSKRRGKAATDSEKE